jgi:hypothetical protein
MRGWQFFFNQDRSVGFGPAHIGPHDHVRAADKTFHWQPKDPPPVCFEQDLALVTPPSQAADAAQQSNGQNDVAAIDFRRVFAVSIGEGIAIAFCVRQQWDEQNGSKCYFA